MPIHLWRVSGCSRVYLVDVREVADWGRSSWDRATLGGLPRGVVGEPRPFVRGVEVRLGDVKLDADDEADLGWYCKGETKEGG